MPDILLIKTSSMGDILHNLPVVTDIRKHYPEANIDWVVEESFAALPVLHPHVRQVIPVAIRRWRKSWWSSRHEINKVYRQLRSRHYDCVVDTQGLLKSALITRCVNRPRNGFDRHSAREPIASLLYDHAFPVAKNQHAVERNRQLAGLALGYVPAESPDYGIQSPHLTFPWLQQSAPYVVLLHATSRDDKLWSESNWIALGNQLSENGFQLVLPWGSETEQDRSKRLAAAIPNALCPPRINLFEAASLLGNSYASIGVDTGLCHLAAALDVPTIGIYTATDPGLTGLYADKNAVNLGGADHTPSVAETWATFAKLTEHV